MPRKTKPDTTHRTTVPTAAALTFGRPPGAALHDFLECLNRVAPEPYRRPKFTPRDDYTSRRKVTRALTPPPALPVLRFTSTAALGEFLAQEGLWSPSTKAGYPV